MFQNIEFITKGLLISVMKLVILSAGSVNLGIAIAKLPSIVQVAKKRFGKGSTMRGLGNHFVSKHSEGVAVW